MGIILKTYTVTGNQGSARLQALFDTGSDVSLVRRNLAERLGTFTPTGRPLRMEMADGEGTFSVNEMIHLFVEIGDATVFFLFYVAENLGEEMIIGADMMQRWKIKLDPEQEDIMPIDPRVLRMRV